MDGHRRQRAQVLHPEVASERLTVGRVAPPPDLAWCVDYAWWVAWDTPEPHVQEVIPRPVVHVAAERIDGVCRLVVTGVQAERFDRELVGRDRTVALAFRPGGFRPFIERPASTLVDRRMPIEPLVGTPDRGIAERLLDPEVETEAACTELLGWFAALAAEPDPRAVELAALVETVERDSTIVRAEQLADLAGVSLRSLQRRFREHIGPGPKSVVQRYRLLDVAEMAHAGGAVDWAAIAAELGYSDQSHLIRHFRAVVGEPPAHYVGRRDG